MSVVRRSTRKVISQGRSIIAHTRLANRIDEVATDRPILAYCRTGNRAAAAASLLRKEGYDVTLVDGMFSSWPGWIKEIGVTGRAVITDGSWGRRVGTCFLLLWNGRVR